MIKVGCCGFPTSMKRYFETFSLVELSSTFYQYPREKTIEGWRAKASQNFEFTVKAHQDISHKSKLKVNKLSLQAFERMKQICRTLSAKVLLIQTPSSFGPDRLADAENSLKLSIVKAWFWLGKLADVLGKQRRREKSFSRFWRIWMLPTSLIP